MTRTQLFTFVAVVVAGFSTGCSPTPGAPAPIAPQADASPLTVPAKRWRITKHQDSITDELTLHASTDSLDNKWRLATLCSNDSFLVMFEGSDPLRFEDVVTADFRFSGAEPVVDAKWFGTGSLVVVSGALSFAESMLTAPSVRVRLRSDLVGTHEAEFLMEGVTEAFETMLEKCPIGARTALLEPPTDISPLCRIAGIVEDTSEKQNLACIGNAESAWLWLAKAKVTPEEEAACKDARPRLTGPSQPAKKACVERRRAETNQS